MIRKDKCLFFNTELEISEDMVWNYLTLEKVSKVVIVCECWYMYLYNVDSIISKEQPHRTEWVKKHIDAWEKILKEHPEIPPRLDAAYRYHWVHVWMTHVNDTDERLSHREIRRQLKELLRSPQFKMLLTCPLHFGSTDFKILLIRMNVFYEVRAMGIGLKRLLNKLR